MTTRYASTVLINFAKQLLEQVGLDADKAQTVAEILVEADLLGHTTHGLALLAPYLGELEKGGMAKTGAPRVVSDFPAAVTWDGMRLPGPWLTVKAFDLAIERARTVGTCTVVISRSHHIACLAAYLKRVTDAGLMALLSCSAPGEGGVAPHGGKEGVFTPNPLAAAWPTAGDPVIMDVSMSITSYGNTRRAQAEGRKFPAPWLIDAEGHLSNDPAVLFANPRGALMPIGGVDHGHKGYALLLLIEALTGGLAGHGRADPAEGWSACVYLQVLNPAMFGGSDEFRRQTEWMAAACRGTPPREGFDRVRLPGESGLRRREKQLRDGVELYPGILPTLKPWVDKLKVPMPTA